MRGRVAVGLLAVVAGFVATPAGFERAGCRPRPHVTLRVDATLGSELFDGESSGSRAV